MVVKSVAAMTLQRTSLSNLKADVLLFSQVSYVHNVMFAGIFWRLAKLYIFKKFMIRSNKKCIINSIVSYLIGYNSSIVYSVFVNNFLFKNLNKWHF